MVTGSRHQYSRLTEWLSFAISLVAAIGLGSLLGRDWLDEAGWWRTWLAFAGYFLLAVLNTPWRMLVIGSCYSITALWTAFFWAEKMLQYTMAQEGWGPKIVFALLVIWEAIPMIGLGVFCSWANRKTQMALYWSSAILLWVAVEAFWPKVFLWTLAHSQQGWSAVVQSADIGGPYIVGLVLLMVASVPMLVIRGFGIFGAPVRGTIGLAVLAVCLLLLNLGYGHRQIQTWNSMIESKGQDLSVVRLAVVQQDPSFTDSISKMADWTKQLAKQSGEDQGIDLVVWPESTLGTHSLELDRFDDEEVVFEKSLPPRIDFSSLMEIDHPVLLGGKTFPDWSPEGSHLFQTAFLLDSKSQVVGKYHKRVLMPFGEYVPFESRFSGLHELFQLDEFMMPGESALPLPGPRGTAMGVLVCYEDIIPTVVSQTVRAGAGYLVCIINASAFEHPMALNQHLRLARLRAVENRRYLVRCAGTGVSCVVTPVGKIENRIEAMEEGAFVAEISPLSQKTLFTRAGRWFAILAGVMALFVFLWARRTDKPNRRFNVAKH